MSFHYRRGVVLAAVLSLAVLVPGSFRMALAQPAAAAQGDNAPKQNNKRPQRANPLNEALKGLDLTADQKSKIQEIRAQTRKDLSAVADRRSPEGMAKVKEINKKQASDIKASLPVDMQTKFQAAYDAADAKGAAMAGLNTFKRPLMALNLTPEEQAKVDPIAKDAYDKIAALRDDKSLKRADRTSKTDTIITEMKAKVRPLLTPTQQTQLDTLDLKPKMQAGGRQRAGGKNAAPPAEAPVPPAP